MLVQNLHSHRIQTSKVNWNLGMFWLGNKCLFQLHLLVCIISLLIVAPCTKASVQTPCFFKYKWEREHLRVCTKVFYEGNRRGYGKVLEFEFLRLMLLIERRLSKQLSEAPLWHSVYVYMLVIRQKSVESSPDKWN